MASGPAPGPSRIRHVWRIRWKTGLFSRMCMSRSSSGNLLSRYRSGLGIPDAGLPSLKTVKRTCFPIFSTALTAAGSCGTNQWIKRIRVSITQICYEHSKWEITLILIPNAPRGHRWGAFCSARGAFGHPGVHFLWVGYIAAFLLEIQQYYGIIPLNYMSSH